MRWYLYLLERYSSKQFVCYRDDVNTCQMYSITKSEVSVTLNQLKVT